MQIIGILVALGYLVCFVMVLIRQFQNAGAVHGIIGIITCGIWTLIWGWRNAIRLNIKNTMIAWTLLLIVCLAIHLMFGSFYVPGTMPTNTP